jgi:hypothetical protein
MLTIVFCLFATSAYAGNLIHIAGGEFKRQKNWPLDMWGIELESWRDIPTDPVEVQQMLQPYAVHGVTTIGFRLHGGKAGAFFAPDGTCPDKKTAEKFSQTAINIRDHYMATVVSLFSADRRHWLESPDAYHQAVQTVAKLLPSRHSCILVVGDLSSTQVWPNDAPYAMNDPEELLALCRLIERTHKSAIVAIPANVVLPGVAGQMPMFIAADTPDALARTIEAVKHGKPLEPSPVAEATTIFRNRFLTVCDVSGDRKNAVDRYLDHVKQTRLTVNSSSLKKKPARPDADGWISLFDGKTLNGWSTLQRDTAGWSVKDGAIHCAGINGTWLRSKDIYEAFVLQLECRIIKNGNSGVFIWSSLDARSSRFGMEMQIMGRHHDRPETRDTTGAIYDVLAPREDASLPPGEWNCIEITCRPSRIIIKVNDKVVQDFNPNEVKKLKHRLRRGYIGLQDHGDEVWFRNIRIRELGEQ